MTVIFPMRVNDQIKTDTEEWTPIVNCSNVQIFTVLVHYFSPDLKAMPNKKVLP